MARRPPPRAAPIVPPACTSPSAETPRLSGGSSSSASSRPAGPWNLTQHCHGCPVRMRSTNRATIAANSRGLVIEPRCPVSLERPPSRAADQSRVLGGAAGVDDVIERRRRRERSASDTRWRAQSRGRSYGPISRARAAIRDVETGASTDRRELRRVEARAARPIRERRRALRGAAGTASRRRNSGPNSQRPSRVQRRGARLRCQRGPGVDTSTSADVRSGRRRGKSQRDEAAERDAADDGAFDAERVERRFDLIDVAVDARVAIVRRAGARFVAQRERDRRGTTSASASIERPHVLPASLEPGNEDERRRRCRDR